LCRCMSLEVVAEGQFVFHQGEKGDKYGRCFSYASYGYRICSTATLTHTYGNSGFTLSCLEKHR
jgi:hypothetical protein